MQDGYILLVSAGAGTVIDRDFKQLCFRGTGGQKDEHPLLVQPSAGDGVFYIVDILVEVTRQAGESDDKQYGKQAD